MWVPKWKPRVKSGVLSLLLHCSWVQASVREEAMEYSPVGRRELTPGWWQVRAHRDETFRLQSCRLQSGQLIWLLVYIFCILLLSTVSLPMKTSCYLVYMLCVTLVKSLTSSCKYEAIKVCFSCIFTCVSNETQTEDSAAQRSCDPPGDFSTVVSSGRRQQVREGNKTVLFWVP